jgi:hypothetical protein
VTADYKYTILFLGLTHAVVVKVVYTFVAELAVH